MRRGGEEGPDHTVAVSNSEDEITGVWGCNCGEGRAFRSDDGEGEETRNAVVGRYDGCRKKGRVRRH
jgi:hypothetical protein